MPSIRISTQYIGMFEFDCYDIQCGLASSRYMVLVVVGSPVGAIPSSIYEHLVSFAPK